MMYIIPNIKDIINFWRSRSKFRYKIGKFAELDPDNTEIIINSLFDTYKRLKHIAAKHK